MNKPRTRTLAVAFGGIVLSGTLAFGAIASAAGNGDGTDTGRHRPRLTAEEKCERQDEIVSRAEALQEKIADRVIALGEQRTEAEAAGDTEAVARIDQRLERLDRITTKITERLAKFEAWTVEHCAD
ncbi:MAG: hypothetical protein ABMA25_20820 [Ilumatobacteraceae bacterium]